MIFAGLSQLFYPLDLKWRLPVVKSHADPKGKLCVPDLPQDAEMTFSLRGGLCRIASISMLRCIHSAFSPPTAAGQGDCCTARERPLCQSYRDLPAAPAFVGSPPFATICY